MSDSWTCSQWCTLCGLLKTSEPNVQHGLIKREILGTEVHAKIKGVFVTAVSSKTVCIISSF